MGKINYRPGTMVYPLPAVLVSCGKSVEESNLMTASWTGTICSDPAMCYVSIRPERYSHHMVMETMEYTINLTTVQMAKATDWCGVRSGRDYNKWKEAGLTPIKGEMVSCPYVKESPVSIECRVRQVMSLGTHDMFIGEVLNVIVDEDFVNPETSALMLNKLLVYNHGGYYGLDQKSLGHFGFSVSKKKPGK